MNRHWQLVLGTLACFAAPVAAQRPAAAPRPADSLAAEVRALHARLDSALAILNRLQRQAPRDTAKPAGDDLASLRAAAAAAAGRATMQRPDTALPTPFVGR